MPEPTTVYLATDIKKALEDASRREGFTVDELIGRAVRNYLFSRQFHTLRERLAAKAQSKGIVTDQYVFDHIS